MTQHPSVFSPARQRLLLTNIFLLLCLVGVFWLMPNMKTLATSSQQASMGSHLFIITMNDNTAFPPIFPTVTFHIQVSDSPYSQYIVSGNAEDLTSFIAAGLSVQVLETDTNEQSYYLVTGDVGDTTLWEKAHSIASSEGTIVYQDSETLLVAVSVLNELSLLKRFSNWDISVAPLVAETLPLPEDSTSLFQRQATADNSLACPNLVVNGGLEAGDANWTFPNTPNRGGIVGSPVYDGDYAMRLGVPSGSTLNRTAYSTALQRVTIPADADQAILTYWEQPGSVADGVDWRRLLLLNSTNTGVIKNLTGSEKSAGNGQWVQRQFDLLAYKGQTFRLYFEVYNNGSGSDMVNYLDNIVLSCATPVTDTPTATATSTSTPTDMPLPDLTITSMQIALETGDSCHMVSTQLGVYVTIQNIGNLAASSFVLNVNGAEQTVTSLNPTATQTFWFPGYVSGSVNTAIVDSTLQIAESDENNNVLSQQLPIPTLPPTCTPSVTPTATSTPTPTSTSTAIVIDTETPTATATVTDSPTATATATSTFTDTATPTATDTATQTTTPTSSPTPTPTATLDLSTMTIRMGSANAQGLTSVTLPLEVVDVPVGVNLGVVSVNIQYDPAIVTASDCDTSGSEFDLSPCNINQAGVIQLSAIDATGVSIDTLLANITFDILDSSVPLTDLIVQISSVADINSSGLTANAENGQIIFGGCILGDVDCDGDVDATDALLILQFDVGDISGSTQIPPPTGTLYEPACDVNGDGSCNIVDALIALQCVVGIQNSACPSGGTLLLPPIGTLALPLDTLNRVAQAATVSINTIPAGTSGVISLPVLADVPERLGAATIEIGYDPSLVNITNCTTNPQRHFAKSACNINFNSDGTTPDVVRFAILSPTDLSGQFSLADLVFETVEPLTEDVELAIEVVSFVDANGNAVPVRVPGEDGMLEVFLPLVQR